MSFTRPFLFGSVSVLSDRPPVLWWLLPGEGWNAVTNDAVGINYRNGAITEYQGADVKYMG